ncbi:hypothetical protein D3C87_1618620 [compost metagenome]
MCDSKSLLRSYNTMPSWVAWTLRVVRCSRRVPSSVSRAWTWSETVDRGKPRLSPARVKLDISLTRTKVRSSSSLFMGRPLLSGLTDQ